MENEMQLTLKAIRVNKGLTQEEASNGIGVSVETLANYEKGNTFPDVPTLKRIEKFYGIEYKNINFLISKLRLNSKKR